MIWARPWAAILAGGLILLWPALLNGGPILFSDTQAFLVQGGDWFGVWDKPFIYGPALRAADLGISLVIPAVLQGVALSAMLWRVALIFGEAPALRHLMRCALLALGSAAPWFAALLMPDIWAPITVLGLLALGLGEAGAATRTCLVLLTGFAIAVHLSHLPLAAACAGSLAAFRWRRSAVLAAPIVVALAGVLATNAMLFHRAAISPHGAVFMLARLAGDGLLEATLAARCPAANWRLCDWRGRLPTDSDAFLWAGDGPVWSDPGGPIALAPEAGEIVAATMRRDPWGVARAAGRNTVAQLGRAALGDTLTRQASGADRLGPAIEKYLGASARARFQDGLQARDRLAGFATKLNVVQTRLLIAGAFASLAIAAFGSGKIRRLAVCVLVAVLCNAAVTGALSGPHDRYQARIAWLVLLPVLLVDRKTFFFEKKNQNVYVQPRAGPLSCGPV